MKHLPVIRRATPLACAVAVALYGATPAPLHAQESSERLLEEVIVTAQKREESIQDVPISVSFLNTETIDILTSAGADIRFLRGRLPSLNIESSFGRAFPRFYIRGWGNTDFDVNASQPVSLVYDEVVQENPILKGFPAFDLDRIEMLRGPQGTLFGRNTPAGVVKFESKKPTQERDGYFQASYGSYDSIDLEGAIGGGLSDAWSFRLSAKYMTRDDWVDNGFTGRDDQYGGFDEYALRGQMLYDAGGSFTALFNLHYRDLDGTARLFRANIIDAGSNGFAPDYDRDTVYFDGKNIQELDSWGGSAKLEWDLGETTLTSVTGYESIDAFSRGDIDGGFGAVFLGPGNFGPGFIPFDAETADGLPDHEQITQEFRWASNEWGVFDWQVGFFYFSEDITIDTINYETLDGDLANDTVDGVVVQDQQTDAWAIFGSVDYELGDATTLKVGLRYSDDNKDYSAERIVAPLAFLGQQPLGPVFAEADDSEWSGDISLLHSFSDDLNVYGRIARGFRAPSIQGRILFGDTVSVADSETVLSYEAGVKSTLAGGRMRANFNVFSYTVDDAQLTAVGGAANFNQVINANEVEGSGFELDFEALLTDNFIVTAGLSYNDTEINDSTLAVAPCGSGCTVLDPASPDVAGAVLIDGNSLPQAPEWVFSATARWSKPTENGEFYVFADYFYRDEVNFFLYESVEYTGDSLYELGLRAGYKWDSQEVALFGRNITDEEVIVGGIDFNNLTGFINEPAIWGLEYRYGF